MMDPRKMGKQMIDLYKTNFDTTFGAMMMFQEQMERMTNLYWGQIPNLPDEAKKSLNEWNKAHKKNCEGFKTLVDDGFKTLESFTA
jgi:hypothetical protein